MYNDPSEAASDQIRRLQRGERPKASWRPNKNTIKRKSNYNPEEPKRDLDGVLKVIGLIALLLLIIGAPLWGFLNLDNDRSRQLKRFEKIQELNKKK
jgi:flagellar biogenesis protein FliO